MEVFSKLKDAVETEVADLGPDMQVDAYYAQCVDLVPDALEEEFVRNPADIAYWGERLTMAIENLGVTTREKETLKSRLSIEVREQLTARGVGGARGPSNDAVSAEVESNEEMSTMRERMLDAEVEVERMKNRLNAVRAKKDALIALGQLKRLEYHPATVNE